MEAFRTRVASSENLPRLALFQAESFRGIDNLDPMLRINGIGVTPTFRYKGGDANAVDWPAWGYGETLDRVAGITSTFNDGSPLLGDNDDSIKLNGGYPAVGDYYQAANGAAGQVGTGDFVFEFVMMFDDGGSQNAFCSTWPVPVTSVGICFYSNGNAVKCILDDSDDAGWIAMGSSTVTDGHWHHVMVFGDRSGKLAFYVNGKISGTPIDIYTRPKALTGNPFTIGARGNGSFTYGGAISYQAMWESPEWLDTHLQADVAYERFLRLTGFWPTVAGGTRAPDFAQRNAVATVDKIEAGGHRKIYNVGKDWLRTIGRLDANADLIRGYLPEFNGYQLLKWSEDFTQSEWIGITPGDTWSTPIESPRGDLTALGFIADGTTTSNHAFQDSLNGEVTSGIQYTASVFAKAGNLNWCRLNNNAISSAYAYFDLANGVVGSKGAGTDASYIEDWGNGWFRCVAVYTTISVNSILRINPAEANGDINYTGDGSTANVYFWGAQFEKARGATTYMPTLTGVAATRYSDYLQFKGDDGNVGGIGSDRRVTVEADVLTGLASYGAPAFFALSDNALATERILIYGEFTTEPITGHPRMLVTSASGTGGNWRLDAEDWAHDTIRHWMATFETGDGNLWIDDAVYSRYPTLDGPINIDQIDVGENNANSGQLGGILSDFKIHNHIERFRP